MQPLHYLDMSDCIWNSWNTWNDAATFYSYVEKKLSEPECFVSYPTISTLEYQIDIFAHFYYFTL